MQIYIIASLQNRNWGEGVYDRYHYKSDTISETNL